MKNLKFKLLSLLVISLFFLSCNKKKEKVKPISYTIIIDLSDRILLPGQLDKDIFLIEKFFKVFEENSRQNLVLTSKNRFSVKIIPQKNTPLHVEHYEDLLQLYLDEICVEHKNQKISELSKNLSSVLQSLKKEALYGKNSSDYFGVDIWAYLHDNGHVLSKSGYQNTILVLTDGYFDFENQAHVIQKNNLYTSTRFLNELRSSDWKQIAESKDFGLLPIKLEKNTKWIVAGIMGKKTNDILQTEKITYFWRKWLQQSGVYTSNYILNGAKSEMGSSLLQQIN